MVRTVVRVLQAKDIGSKPAGRHSDGTVPGLMLLVRGSGARSWLLRVTVGGKRRDIGLGGYPGVSLSHARQRARELHEAIWRGGDPVGERKAKRSALLAEQALGVPGSGHTSRVGVILPITRCPSNGGKINN